jgi:hypothetical protein
MKSMRAAQILPGLLFLNLQLLQQNNTIQFFTYSPSLEYTYSSISHVYISQSNIQMMLSQLMDCLFCPVIQPKLLASCSISWWNWQEVCERTSHCSSVSIFTNKLTICVWALFLNPTAQLLQGQGQGYITTNRQSVSQYVLVSSPISDNWPEFTFSLKFHLDSYRFVIL